MQGAPCPDCFSGTVHIGNPTGTTTTIHDLPVYVAKPPEGVTPKGIIVMIPDAFGWDFVNYRILSDHYAERGGFLVYLPDFMNGQPPHLQPTSNSQPTNHVPTHRQLPPLHLHGINGRKSQKASLMVHNPLLQTILLLPSHANGPHLGLQKPRLRLQTPHLQLLQSPPYIPSPLPDSQPQARRRRFLLGAATTPSSSRTTPPRHAPRGTNLNHRPRCSH
jgi:hypothetical protein